MRHPTETCANAIVPDIRDEPGKASPLFDIAAPRWSEPGACIAESWSRNVAAQAQTHTHASGPTCSVTSARVGHARKELGSLLAGFPSELLAEEEVAPRKQLLTGDG